MFDIPGAIKSVSGLGTTIIDKIWRDAGAEEKEKMQLLAAEMEKEFQLLLGQIEINKIDAKSESVIQSVWRPFIGWVCGLSLFYAAVFEPFLSFIAVVFFSYEGELPKVDIATTMPVLIGMLGFGGLRTFEKHKGVHK